jgi:hypothetical protein
VDLTVSGGFVSERSESATESRWWRSAAPISARVFVEAQDRRPPRRHGIALPGARVLVDRSRRGGVIDLVVVRVEVLQGLAREVTLAIPPGVVVNQVNGATVADWEARNGLLRVRLLDPVATELSFVVQGESRLPADGDISVPLVRVPAAERETGGVAISVLGAGEIRTAPDARARGRRHRRHSRHLGRTRIAIHGGVPPQARRRNDLRSLGISVKRYTPQAVLIANVEEARYRALVAEDGLLLVEAHYAVRNNQRSFLKITLPQGATIWSASVAGKPVRPGVAEGEAVLLALEKSRAGEDAPTFVVRITYVQPVDLWKTRRARISNCRRSICRCRGPASSCITRLAFKIALQPGTFRIESDPGVFAEALRYPARCRRSCVRRISFASPAHADGAARADDCTGGRAGLPRRVAARADSLAARSRSSRC